MNKTFCLPFLYIFFGFESLRLCLYYVIWGENYGMRDLSTGGVDREEGRI